MLKTDARLQKDVIDELRWDPAVGPCEVGVAARDGVVTLSGQVDSFAKRYAAVRCAERVVGVRAVADELVVALPSSSHPTDTDLAHAAADALRWDAAVPDDRVQARVEKGWVWLEGDVEWSWQSEAAERAVRGIAGVRGLTNVLQVVQRARTPAP